MEIFFGDVDNGIIMGIFYKTTIWQMKPIPLKKAHSMVRCGHSQEKNMVQNGFEGDGINPLIYLVFIKVPLVNCNIS